jgi:N-acetyl sugar amidotransferase
MKYRICTTCVLDTTDADISFDEKGICNYCTFYATTYILSGKYTGETLSKLVESIKKRGARKKYDCLLGISGGPDSSYALHQTKELGLRTLAVHFDSGWNTPEAEENIKKLIGYIGCDLYVYKMNWQEFKAMQVAYLKAGVIDLEVPTDHSFHAALYKIAHEKNISTILTGHNFKTEAIMPSSWIYDKQDVSNIRDIYQQYGNGPKLKDFPLLTFCKKFYYFNVKKIALIHLLNYMDYDKKTAMEMLDKKYDWKPFWVKHGESVWTRFYQCYILKERFHADKRRAHFSNMIMSGQMTREEALLELEKPVYHAEDLIADKKYVLDKLEISEEDFEHYMTMPVRSHLEFKSDRDLKRFYTFLRKNIPLLNRWLRTSGRH